MDNCTELKVSSKTVRKQKKSQRIIEKETGIGCSKNATRCIAICNAGLVNGLSEETVYEHFIKYGRIESILMLPGKSYCFVAYGQINFAANAYNNINGKLNIGQYNKPIYLQYVNGTPEVLKTDRSKKPSGLYVQENFVTETEEIALLGLNTFDDSETGTLRHRRVKHYGYEFQYDVNNVSKDRPLKENVPDECVFLLERLKSADLPFNDFTADQLTVNQYKPGQGIPPHVDTHSAFEDPLVLLSLGSSIVMEFKKGDLHYPVFLPQRSLTIMSGESRYNWTHGIVPRKLDIVPSEKELVVIHRGTRTSYTFRKVRKGKCDCKYFDKCDSYAEKLKSKAIESDLAVKLENTHVHNVYENIASHFSDTRHKPWPNVLEFLQSLKVGSILIDIGCGNGKYLGCVNNIFSVGCDRSFNLIEVCSERGFQAFTCNCLNVPVKNNIADAVISIAVIHHIANEERRVRAVKEMVRILRTEGRGLIYVWAKDQNKNQEKTSYLKQDRRNRKEKSEIVRQSAVENIAVIDDISLPVHTNRTQFQHQDLLVPWKLKSGGSSDNEHSFLRFYHVFEDGELENLCAKLDGIRILKSYYDQGNWCCMFEKVK